MAAVIDRLIEILNERHMKGMKGIQMQKEMDTVITHKTMFGTFDFQHLISPARIIIIGHHGRVSPDPRSIIYEGA